jgi:hypothetical protein
MIDLSDRRAIRERIAATGDARETAVVLAARSALRVLPLLVKEYDIKKSKGALEFPFQIFGAADITWIVARYPHLRGQFRSLAHRHRVRMNRVGPVNSAMTFAVSSVDSAAGAAPFAAAEAAADAASGAIEGTRYAFAGRMGYNFESKAGVPDDDDGTLSVADAALASDFDLIESGVSPSDLAGRALWPSEVPIIIRHCRDELGKNLSNRSNWDVWTEWYLARVLGHPSDETIESRRVTIVARYPTHSIEAVNAAIKELAYDRNPGARWKKKLAALKQTPLGAKFIQRDHKLAIDPAGQESDEKAARDLITVQLHEGIERRAQEFSEIAKRVDNHLGWSGLGEAAARFSAAVGCETDDVPSRIGVVYESIVSLGSFLDLDARLRSSPDQSSADPLGPEVHRAFIDLIRVAAPWVRRFPTARKLDDEAGSFLTKTEHFEAAARIVRLAESTSVIAKADSRILEALIEAGKRAGFQAEKARTRSLWSSKNLVTALAVVFSFETGLINNKAAEQSIIAQNGAKLYLEAEAEILRLFEDAPEDIRQALVALLADLREVANNNVPNLPEKPKEHFDLKRSRKDEESADER